MLMLRELLIDSLRSGVPVIAAIMGYRFGSKRSSSFWRIAGYTAGGFLGGWLAQALALKLLEGPKPQLGKLPMSGGQMPTPAAPSAPPSDAPMAGVQPPPPPPAPAPAAPSAPPAAAPTSVQSNTRLGEGVTVAEVPESSYDAAKKISEGDHVQVRGTLLAGAFGGNGSV